MARGQWSDFISVIGFASGETLEPRDMKAREFIVSALNRNADVMSHSLRAVPTRPLGGNPCMISLQDAEGESELPREIRIADLIREAYGKADDFFYRKRRLSEFERVTWDDFSQSSGFYDGEGDTDFDWPARDIVIKELNENEALKKHGLVAMPMEASSLHNECVIEIYEEKTGLEVELPEELKGEPIQAIIDAAYEEVYSLTWPKVK